MFPPPHHHTVVLYQPVLALAIDSELRCGQVFCTIASIGMASSLCSLINCFKYASTASTESKCINSWSLERDCGKEVKVTSLPKSIEFRCSINSSTVIDSLLSALKFVAVSVLSVAKAVGVIPNSRITDRDIANNFLNIGYLQIDIDG